LTHIPGNHDASEACPLVDAGRSRRKVKLARKKKVKLARKKKVKLARKKKGRSPSIQKLGKSPEAHGSKPFAFTVRIRISRCCGDLAVTYAENEISHINSRRRSPCWRSWSAVIPQIKRRNLKNPLKNITQNP